ncbi:MAG: hypothetical protein ABJG49_18490, partial [Roseibium sp.]|uniref:hypothetical protein n=1 Tax=Roseibium sp. TaxID=1936156 RepID=UPI003299D7B0
MTAHSRSVGSFFLGTLPLLWTNLSPHRMHGHLKAGQSDFPEQVPRFTTASGSRRRLPAPLSVQDRSVCRCLFPGALDKVNDIFVVNP